jgi:membrane associated rhomboid family serine protease
VILPIGHDQGVRKMPWVTIGIIAICTLMQLYQTLFAPSEDELVTLLITDPEAAEAALLAHPLIRFGYATGSGFSINLVTSAFVHDGWFHLAGNMLFLWLAGSAVEDRWGRVQFLLFFLASAAVSAFAFDAFHSGDRALLVGASGAVSATMGAFLVHYSKTTITFVWFMFFRAGSFRWPAWVALPLWLADQALWAYLSHSGVMPSPIAYAAHFAGFAFGVVAALFAKRFLPDAAPDLEERVYSSSSAAAAQPSPSAVAAAPAGAPKYAQLVAAIETRDLGTARMIASRTILDLARAENVTAIVELYKRMIVAFDRLPLTDGAYASAARAADRLGDRDTFIAIAETAIAEHPGSSQMPWVMWRLAEHRRDAGELDAAIDLLRTLASRFPRDPLAQQAQQALASRGIE